MTAFVTSPVFIVLLGLFAPATLAFVVWLMRDGPTPFPRQRALLGHTEPRYSSPFWRAWWRFGYASGLYRLSWRMQKRRADRRRGGMVDLVGAKPRGIAWDWPSAPGVVRITDESRDDALLKRLAISAEARSHAVSFIEPRDLDAERKIRTWTDEHPAPDRRPSFRV